MRYIKKILVPILLLAVVVAFVACANDEPQEEAADILATEEDYNAVPTPTPEPAEMPEPTEEPEQLADAEGPEATPDPAEDNEPVAEPGGTRGTFPFAFTAEDLYGNEVTAESIGDFDVFFVYYWTTWCQACVMGMPGLAEIAAEFGDRVGFLSVLGDFEGARDAAINITEGSGIPFITIDANLPELADLMALLQSGFVPTSVLVDAEGNQIGEQIIGSATDLFRSAIEDALSS